ncbi:MAG: hypothetical protein E2P02_16775 [Acidobacteria bacterium]|nr:MAG: hypothetical protein E2P02_16775 [Acidobacteriota bacterium]
MLFNLRTGAGLRIGAANLDTSEWHALDEVGEATEPLYVATGHLLYTQNDSLWAVSFDLEELRPTGSPVPVLNDFFATSVLGNTSSQLDVARNGNLVYAPAGSAHVGADRLVWVDRNGKTEALTDVEVRHEISIDEDKRGRSGPRVVSRRHECGL